MNYVHQALLFDHDEQLVDTVVPYIHDAVQSGQPALISLSARHATNVRDALGDTADADIEFGDHATTYRRPATTIRSFTQRFGDRLDAGAQRIHVTGDVPHTGSGANWDNWRRYEFCCNHAFADLPVWSLCPYDTRITPDRVLDDVLLTHTHVTDGHHPVINPHFTGHLPPSSAHEPSRTRPPDLTLTDPTPRQSRAVASTIAATAHLNDDAAARLLLSISELCTNALQYGRPPTTLQLWSGPARAAFAVTDCGAGVSDPCAGLLPPSPGATNGRGLWLVHQLADDVTLGHVDGAFHVTGRIHNETLPTTRR